MKLKKVFVEQKILSNLVKYSFIVVGLFFVTCKDNIVNDDNQKSYLYDENAIKFLKDIESQLSINNPNYYLECYCDTNNNEVLDPLEIQHLEWEYSESEEMNYLTGISLISSGQYLDSIPASIQYVKSLENLTISNSNMVTIPSEIFTLPILRTLNLYNNNISELPDLFYQLDSTISIINLNSNNLAEIPPSLFELNNAELINLNNNQIFTLPDEICNLNDNTQIFFTENELCLRDDVPDCFENNIENQTKCYSELDLNGIQAIIDSNFVTTETCECDLNLNGVVEPFEFGNQTWQLWTENARLKETKFSNLSTFPKVAFEVFTELENLDIAENNLDTIFNEIENLSSLMELDLSHNNLNSLPEVMVNLNELINLKVNENDSLKYIPNLIQLDELNIFHTNLFCENGEYDESQINSYLNNSVLVIGAYMQFCYMQPDLEFLENFIDNNGLFTDWENTGIQNWMNGRLTQFEISNEISIDEIPESIENLTEITQFNLSNSELNIIPSSFENLTKLESLILLNNDIDTLGLDFGNFPQLQFIDISSNNIHQFPESVCQLPIVEIQFKDNRICDGLEPPCAIFYWEDQILTQRCKNLNDIQFIESLIEDNGLIYDYYSFGEQLWQEFETEELDRLVSFKHIGGNHSNDTLFTIPVNISNLNYIEKLELENHSISSIPTELYFLSTLKELNLKSNEIIDLPNLIIGLDLLKY